VTAEDAECAEPSIYSGFASNAEGFAKSSYKVVSLNMARETRVDKILQDIREAKQLADAEVWLLQEVAQPTTAKPVVPELARALSLNYVFAPTDILENRKLLSGLAILSRYPIEDPRFIPLSRYKLRINTRCRIALEAKVSGPPGPIQLYNVHLDTRLTRQQRVDQLDPVLQAATSFSGPAVAGGDFNTANVRWIWNILPVPYGENHSDRVRDIFRRLGFDSPLDRMPATIDFPLFPLRLDWIFPRGLASISAGVENIDFSDHKAVWVEFSSLNSQ
jgi:endonuclease/exonuclease/phosphatase (EEP) superfamily protein YafD